MKHPFLSLLLTLVLLAAAAPYTRAQEPQEPNIDEIINTQIDNISRNFKLDDVQIFFLDSILQHNFPAMMDELGQAKKTGASNEETYQAISDKWMARTDEAIKRLFSEDQWERYLKSSYGKEKKRRDKRMKERGDIQ